MAQDHRQTRRHRTFGNYQRLRRLHTHVFWAPEVYSKKSENNASAAQ